jgi:hypothetical protein
LIQTTSINKHFSSSGRTSYEARKAKTHSGLNQTTFFHASWEHFPNFFRYETNTQGRETPFGVTHKHATEGQSLTTKEEEQLRIKAAPKLILFVEGDRDISRSWQLTSAFLFLASLRVVNGPTPSVHQRRRRAGRWELGTSAPHSSTSTRSSSNNVSSPASLHLSQCRCRVRPFHGQPVPVGIRPAPFPMVYIGRPASVADPSRPHRPERHERERDAGSRGI